MVISMITKLKDIVTVCLIGAILFGFFAWCIIKPSDEISESERRPLASFPELNADTLISGEFMSKFEEYTTDQFPIRDTLRTIKALSVYYLFQQADNNDIYFKDSYASKLEFPVNEDSLASAAQKFKFICDKYLNGTDASIYFSLVPDKNYFMAAVSGYPSIDYDEFVNSFRQQTAFMEYIDIMELLTLSDYYKTDTHWRQECIVDVALKLADAMGTTLPDDYKQNTLDVPFYGVYYGQAALPIPGETLHYLSSDILDSCIVYDFETESYMPMYDLEKAHGQDAYEIFLSGSKSLITIENPNSTTEKELIIFRDSFGSSIAPLLAAGYAKTTIVDIRYISSNMLDNWIEFDDQDVLFLYSTIVLNNSITFK